MGDGKPARSALELPKGYSIVEASVPCPGIGSYLVSLAAHVGSAEGEMPMDELRPLLRILLGCVPRSHDPLIRNRASDVWNSLLNKRGGKTVSEACVATLAAASKRATDVISLWVIFRWSCKLATLAAFATENPFLEGTSFAKLAQLQFSILSRIAESGKKKFLINGMAQFGALLLRFKTALTRYLDVLTSCKDPAEVAGGATVLLAHCEAPNRKDSPDSAEARPVFIKLYRASILDATEGKAGREPPLHLTVAFRPLFRSLTHDYVAALVPDMCRVMRRTPDLFVGSLAETLMHMSVDLGRYVEQFTPVLVEGLFREKNRHLSLALATSIAKQSSDLSVLAQLGSEISKKVTSKDVKNWQERLGLVQGLHMLLTVPKGKGINLLADEILIPIVTLTDKEANDETKCAGLAVLGCCLKRAEKLPGEAVKLLSKSFESGVDSVRRCALQCIGEGMQASELRDKAGGLVTGLLKVVQAAEKKPGLRGDAIIAARILLVIASADESESSKLDEAKFWGLLAGPSSYIAAMAEEGSPTPDEALALVEVCDVLLRDYTARLNKIKDLGRDGVIGMMVGLLIHGNYEVHSAAAAAIKSTHGNDPELVKAMIEKLHSLMRREAPRLKQPLPSQEKEGPVITHCSRRFGRAILAAVPGTPQKDLLGRLMLMSHSPVVLSGSQVASVWDTIGKRYAGVEGGLEGVVRSVAGKLCEEVLGDHGTRSDSEFDRACALGAIQALAKQALSECLPLVVDSVRGDMDGETVCSFTDKDIIVYRTPAGQLARFEQFESGYVPEARQEHNVKISKEEKKLYGALAKEFAAEKEAKKGKEKPKMTKQEEEVFNARLAEEAELRETIEAVRTSAELGLSVIESLVRGNRIGMHEHLGTVSQLVWPLARAPQQLVGASVLRVAQAMSLCCARRLSPQVPEALYTVACAAPDASLPEEQAALVRSGVKRLQADLRGQSLPVPSFVYILPLLRFALNSPAVGAEMQDGAMKTVSQHANDDKALPRAQIIGVLLGVMAANVRLRKVASEVVLKLCVSLCSRDIVELLNGSLAPEAAVRSTCIDGLAAVPGLPGAEPHEYLHATLFLLMHDADEGVRQKAADFYDSLGMSAEDVETSQLTELLSHSAENVRKAAAESLAELLKRNPSAASETISLLKTLYIEAKGSGVFTRSGVALTLHSIAEYLTKRELIVLFPTLVSDKDQGLSDPDDGVRAQMMQAGLRLIELHGETCKDLLTPMFENQLNKTDSGTYAGDLLKEGVVIFLATLSKFLPKGDPKVAEVMNRLLKALRTPSESVQRASATCMSPLMSMLGGPDEVGQVVRGAMSMLLEGETYGDRRGGAYGLAGVVKGLGISALKAHDIMPTLQSAAGDKKDPRRREGALFGFECLSDKLGRLFEPYVIHILPILLNSCGDADPSVREAADAAAKIVMSQLSGQGVKLVMPALLQGVEDRTWRTKSAAVDLLGAMAYCAPKQLGTCLPTIVPVLAQAVSDTHSKVRDGAKAALSQVGNVIKNPEINAIAATLIASLSDPDLTAKALEVVIETTFVNAVDAPSLALLVPVVQRGLKHRSTDLKKKASTIVGNMCNLVSDPKDVAPYLNDLVPILKSTILDPSPEVRQTAAAALGSLVKSMDDSQYAELEKYLLFTMKSDASMVERAGAAQGLGEVLGKSPIERFENILPEVMLQCEARLSHIREGYLALMACLPNTMGPALESFIPKILPTILSGLSDEVEAVREVALKAGHGVVAEYAETAMPLVLPAIEKGLFDDAWRIRSSSVHLLGDVLSKITGRNWKIMSSGVVDDLDEGTGDKSSEAKIGDVLGTERRDVLISAVYMLRSDVNTSVCQASYQVWKSVVQSQLKTLRTILPTLMKTLVNSLASGNLEKQTVAGRAMGELVGKMGERALPDVIPILQNSLSTGDAQTRAGVCLGLAEVIANCTKQQIFHLLEDLVTTVRRALCDSEHDVRVSSGRAFDALFKQLGQRAIEEVVPALLNNLEDESANTLAGLRQLLSVRGNIVLPFLIPVLSAPPMTASNARALAALAEVAGDSLSSRIPTILSALSDGMEEGDSPEEIAIAAEHVVLSVPQDGVRLMLLELLRRCEDVTTSKTRASSARLIKAFCSKSSHDYEQFHHDLVKALVHLFGDAEEEVLVNAHAALAAMVTWFDKFDKKEDDKAPAVSCGVHVTTVLHEVKMLQLTMPESGVPGFNRSKGLAPVLPFFLQALMHGGTPETREQAAQGLGELVACTSEAALKPMVVQMSGPLIRIMGDRFPWQVKAAILQTLLQLLVKGGVMMKPFLPQLQTIFIKSLNENSKIVRGLSVKALAKLVTMSPRVDPLLNDLLSGSKTAEGGIKLSFLHALELVVGAAGKSASQSVMTNVLLTLEETMASDDDDVRGSAAAAYGAHASNSPDEDIGKSVLDLLDNRQDWTQRHGRTMAAAALIKHLVLSGRHSAAVQLEQAAKEMKRVAGDDRAPVREAVAQAAGKCVLLARKAGGQDGEGGELGKRMWIIVCGLAADSSPEVKASAIAAIKTVAKSQQTTLPMSMLELATPPVYTSLKDKNQSVRSVAERCILHLMLLYLGTDLASQISKSMKEVDGNGLVEYCKRTIAKGPDAIISSDTEE